MAVYYLHDIIHGAKWVRFLDKVFCETGIFTSNHPTHHKYAAISHLYNRLNTYNLMRGRKM